MSAALSTYDLQVDRGRVRLPNNLAKKYPHADREWVWQWVFPAATTYFDRETLNGIK